MKEVLLQSIDVWFSILRHRKYTGKCQLNLSMVCLDTTDKNVLDFIYCLLSWFNVQFCIESGSATCDSTENNHKIIMYVSDVYFGLDSTVVIFLIVHWLNLDDVKHWQKGIVSF